MPICRRCLAYPSELSVTCTFKVRVARVCHEIVERRQLNAFTCIYRLPLKVFLTRCPELARGCVSGKCFAILPVRNIGLLKSALSICDFCTLNRRHFETESGPVSVLKLNQVAWVIQKLVFATFIRFVCMLKFWDQVSVSQELKTITH